MYSFLFDTETGGILLGDQPTRDYREPRPVWAQEMDYLGFNRFWEYDDQAEDPFLWFSKCRFYYRGVNIATIKGGDYFNKPELIPENILWPPQGGELLPIDLPGMVDKNAKQMARLTEFSIEKTLNVWKEYKNKVDLFKVAFSGGKDSEAVLAVVRNALPSDGYVVIFGDTGMEFPDTYKVVDQVKTDCEQAGIRFYSAKSKFNALDSWWMFGPPSRQLRWCHRVLKTTPTTLLCRQIVGKNVVLSMDIVGCRKNESLRRSKYEYVCFSKQQNGQYSFYPILEWSSAEVWLKIFFDGLPINNAYKLGSSRAGCTCCPMSRGRNNHWRQFVYPETFGAYMDVVNSYYGKQDKTFYNKVCWGNRRNARFFPHVKNNYSCVSENGVLQINVINPVSDWQEWFKTIGEPVKTDRGWSVRYGGNVYEFTIQTTTDGYTVKTISPVKIGAFSKRFKNVFRKAAYCVGCQACEADCVRGNLKFIEGKPKISGDCSDCSACHDIEKGCLRYNSLKDGPNVTGAGQESSVCPLELKATIRQARR